MSDDRTLGEWFDVRDGIVSIYREELGRDVIADPDALTNWLHHWRESAVGLAWIRARIRESDEWEQRHGGPAPDLPPPAQTPEPPPQVPEQPPYNGGGGGGRLIKVTEGGLINRGYSDKATAWVDPINGRAYVFVGHVDGRPRFFSVRLDREDVAPVEMQMPYGGEAESWYWNEAGYIYLIDGPRLRLVNPFSGEDRVVFDISARFPGHDLWQANSSDDGQTHSATVRRIVNDGKYPYVGTAVYRYGSLHFFPAEQSLDESQITRCGNYVVIKEGDGPDNRVVTLDTGEIRGIPDRARAMGHSDCGLGIVVGEADKPDPGMCGWWDLTQPLTEDHFHPLFPTLNMGYVSYRGGRLLHSGDRHLSLIDMQTGASTPIVEHHANAGNDYDLRVKAALSPCGTVAAYVSRGALYVVVL